MATLSGTIQNVSLAQVPLGIKEDSSGRLLMTVLVTFTITGTYAQADDAQLLLVKTGIEDATRSGITIANILGACMASAGDEAGTPIGVGAITVSGATLSFPLTGGDLTTEHSSATLGTLAAPIGIFVTFTYTPPA